MPWRAPTRNPRSWLQRAAFRDSGFAVAGLECRLPLAGLSVRPESVRSRVDGLVATFEHGWADAFWWPAERRKARLLCAVIMAGSMAESRFMARPWYDDFWHDDGLAASDLEQWKRLALSAYSSDEYRGFLTLRNAERICVRRAEGIMVYHWPAVTRIAERLIVQRKMRSDQCRAIFDRSTEGSH